MPAAFFKLAHKCVHNPKRIVWAYVDLKNEQDEPMQDIILPVCYRNPPWALSIEHSLGFGIYREQLVQYC